MELTKTKKKLWVIAPAFMAITSIAFLASSCGKKNYSVNVTCNNSTIDGEVRYNGSFQENAEVTLSFKANTTYALNSDIEVKHNDQKLVKDTDYTYSKETGEMKFIIKGDVDITVDAKKGGALDDYSWREIKDISDNDKAKECFKIGATKDVLVNGVTHTVRIIGFDHDCTDNLKPDETKIGITFEFENLLSDENGYSLAAYWKNTNATTIANNNYRDSTIRAALNGEGTAEINWFQYFGMKEDEQDDEEKGIVGLNRHFSEEYAGKSVLSMLPDYLTNVLTAPSKYTSVYKNDIGDFADMPINDKLFLLSPREMGYEDEAESQEYFTTPYEFYNGHTELTDNIRIKHQVKGHDGAREQFLSGIKNEIDGTYTGGAKFVFAGYDLGKSNNYGGDYWLRSPYTKNPIFDPTQPSPYPIIGYETCNDSAWGVSAFGTTAGYYQYAFSGARGVAPAFCI